MVPASEQRLVRTLYASAFLEDCVLLYPVYALLFSRTGLSGAEISSLFVLWSVTGLALEIPSGVWADRFSRRRLLTLAPALSGAGFALWTFAPSYAAFAAGFVLWGAGSALRSGTLEALVYEELARCGASDRYARRIGRSRAVGTCAEVAATAAAAPALAAGGYQAVGVASVLACAAGVLVARTFPEHSARAGGTPADPADAASGGPAPDGGRAPAAAEEAEESFRAVLRHGVAEIRHSRAARRAVLLVAVLTGSLAYDEFLSLFAASTGVADATVPLLVLLVSAGAAVGEWFAHRGHRLLVPGLVVSGVLLALGGLSAHPAGMGLIAVAYGVARWSATAAEARLQARISDRARATVGSMAGFGSEVMAILVFAAYGLGSTWSPPGPLIAAAALPPLGVALLLGLSRSADAMRSRTAS
ncbi:MFS transporter [Streptomyces sp. RKND-216]|uniref:MFS transporter n=1 Tax=Streptomyces sp. RKND-216 TaxID=2562581 RepID=UPI00109DD674|nr:MFS transporter [Streptomyces sp. RKND-216]THA23861.1 MFS transporter [Streptomyces sp. RKND-216]